MKISINKKNEMLAFASMTQCLLLVFCFLFVSKAHAQDRLMPPLYGASQIVITAPLFNDKKVSESCEIDAARTQEHILNILREEQLPVFAQNDSSNNQRTDMLRINLTPEIVTLRDGSINCVSWLALRAEAAHTVRLPPVREPKTVTVTYWQKGGLIQTPVLRHEEAVRDGYTLLARQMARQWRLDNPQSLAPAP